MPFKNLGNGIYKAIQVVQFPTLESARKAAKEAGLKDENKDEILKNHIHRGLQDKIYKIKN